MNHESKYTLKDPLKQTRQAQQGGQMSSGGGGGGDGHDSALQIYSYQFLLLMFSYALVSLVQRDVEGRGLR